MDTVRHTHQHLDTESNMLSFFLFQQCMDPLARNVIRGRRAWSNGNNCRTPRTEM